MPSIVIGVFAYGVAVLPFKQFSAMAGGFALGVMMIPIIARTTEELLLLVPGTMREGALALGATRARAVFSVVLPAALPGIVTGVVLALARIAGETAPLLFTSFNNRFFTTKPEPADLDADRPGLHLRDRPVRGLAPPGLGRRARAGHHRPRVLAAGALRDPAPGADARPQLTTTTINAEPAEPAELRFLLYVAQPFRAARAVGRLERHLQNPRTRISLREKGICEFSGFRVVRRS